MVKGHSIAGAWVTGSTGGIDVVDPTTGEVVDRVPEATGAEVESAVLAARAALPAWSETPPEERSAILSRLAIGFTERRELIARTITLDVGSPIEASRRVQAWLPTIVASTYAELAGTYAFEQRLVNSLVVEVPVGVAAAITPWNYPLSQAVLKIAPALAAGCTVVVKPSEVAPLVMDILGDIATEAGVPPGVLNLLHGTGALTGEALVTQPGVDMVSFTGSTRAGRRIATLAAQRVTKVTLELGGKSATVVLPDTDEARFEAAVRYGVRKCFMNSGQSCNALSRLIVPADRQGVAVEIAVDAASSFPVGDPNDEATRIGPMVSSAQRDKVLRLIGSGVSEGARLVLGGSEPPTGLTRGFFVQPTIFADVRPEITIAQEEVFGPVLSVIPYAHETDAVEIANGTPYGLAAAVWSNDSTHAVSVARLLRAGQIDVNGSQYNPNAPFGGFGLSGYGREYGIFGLREYLATKALQL